MPHHCWVSGLFCNVSLNALYDDLRHRNIPVCTDILEELFCLRRDPELRGGCHIDIPMVVGGISTYKFEDLQVYHVIRGVLITMVGMEYFEIYMCIQGSNKKFPFCSLYFLLRI